MSQDARLALIAQSDWALNVYAMPNDHDKSGFRPISVKFVGDNTAGQIFSLVFVKNSGVLQTSSPPPTIATNKTAQEMIDLVTAAGKTSKPLRCIALESYLDPNLSQQKYAAIFIENTGADAKRWFWHFNVSADFILSELDQSKTGSDYPLRAIHIGPNQRPVGQPYNYDFVAIHNVGADNRWHWIQPASTLDGIQTLINKHANHKARIYQLACTKNPTTDSHPWSVILVDGSNEAGFFDEHLGQYNDGSALVSLAQQRDARVLDFVRNGSGNPPGEFAVSMVKCTP